LKSTIGYLLFEYIFDILKCVVIKFKVTSRTNVMIPWFQLHSMVSIAPVRLKTMQRKLPACSSVYCSERVKLHNSRIPQSRTRTCLNGTSGVGGCPGSDTDTQSCQAPVNCWGEWTAYGDCTVTCGGGVQTRTRWASYL